jgi:hypothetical protein
MLKVTTVKSKPLLLVIACAFLLICCKKDESSPIGTGQALASEGQWLKYWSGPQPMRLNLNVRFYAVHFSKPSDWPAARIDSIQIVSASSGATLKLSFWGTSTTQGGTYWPSDPPTQTASKTIAQGLNSWGVTDQQWKTSSSEFFIGFEQGSVTTLCSDGQANPEVRSYRCYAGSSWEKESGMFSNYCIAAYVTRASN